MNFSKKNQELKKRNRNEVSKTLFTFVLALMVSLASYAQEKKIETESVTLDNLIMFIVDHYGIQTDSTEIKNTTFLIETYSDRFNTEDSVILKQVFKIVSKRATTKDLVSIVLHSNLNGVVLNSTKAKDIKTLLYAIEHPKASIKTVVENGIELAYKTAKDNFIKSVKNTVVMIRIPNRAKEIKANTTVNSIQTETKKSNLVVLSAIALLPELISIIKN